MIRRGICLSLAFMVFSAASARSEAVAIDHKSVGCIVVGKYPKMDACFTPAADLARSRVYFRPEGVSAWYYVDMKADQACFAGTLPKPGKKLVGKKIEYYLEAQNKAFEPARTAEFAPIVVRSAQECKKDVPVAPFLNNATVAVFPSVPAGFVGVGGIGTAAVVGIVGAGAAVATTAAVVASNNNSTTTTSPVVVNPTTTTTVVAATTTTTTTTLPRGQQPAAVRGAQHEPRSPVRQRPAHRDVRPVQEHRPRKSAAQLLLRLRRRREGFWFLRRVTYLPGELPLGRRACAGSLLHGGSLRR